MDQSGNPIEQAPTLQTPLKQEVEAAIKKLEDVDAIPPEWYKFFDGNDTTLPSVVRDPELDRFLATKKISDAFDTRDPRVVTLMLETVNTIVKTLPFTI